MILARLLFCFCSCQSIFKNAFDITGWMLTRTYILLSAGEFWGVERHEKESLGQREREELEWSSARGTVNELVKIKALSG